MKLRTSVTRTLRAYRHKRKETDCTQTSEQSEAKQHSSESDADVTCKEIGPSSPQNSNSSTKDEQDKPSKDDASSPNKRLKRTASKPKNGRRPSKKDGKLKSLNSEEESKTVDDDPELELIIDDEHIGMVKETLEQLPEHFAKEYCAYLLSLQNGSKSTSKKNTRRMFLGKEDAMTNCQDCFICDEKCDSPLELKKHIKIQHEGPKGYYCPLCDKTSKNFRYFNDHLANVHTKCRTCPYCSLPFFGINNLRKHVGLAHPGKHKYICTLCKKEFLRGIMLMMHLNTHTGLTPHKCQDCPKAYSSSESLKEHQKHHAKDKLQFKCEVCEKVFVSIKLLNIHSRFHGEERNYKCSLCNKTFKVQQNLVAHKLWHNKERKFSCDVCDSSFKRKFEMKRHILLVHKQNFIDKAVSNGVENVSNNSIDLNSAKINIDSAEIENDSATIENDTAAIENDSAAVDNDSAKIEIDSAAIENDSAAVDNDSAAVEINKQPLNLKKNILADFVTEDDSEEDDDCDWDKLY